MDRISHFVYQEMNSLVALGSGAALQFMNGHIPVDGNRAKVAVCQVIREAMILMSARAGTPIPE